MTLCPLEISSTSGCLNSTPWRAQPSWGTDLTTSYRNATVAYGLTNGSILSYSFSEPTANPVPISASDLLQVFDKVMRPMNNSTLLGQELSKIGFASSQPVMPFYIYWYFQELGDLSMASESSQRRAMTGFQSLLSIPLYHCQAKDFYGVNSLNVVRDIPISKIIAAYLPSNQADTVIAPAELRYSIMVGPRGLIPFAIIGGVSLLLCIAAFSLSCTSPGRKLKPSTAFPLLDDIENYRIIPGFKRGVISEKERLLEAGKCQII
jgi:hypothetical protein